MKARGKKKASRRAPVPVQNESALAALMGDHAGAGLENVDSESIAIPFLRVLQSNSPQCDEAQAEFMEGARPGMFLETVSGELFDGKRGIENLLHSDRLVAADHWTGHLSILRHAFACGAAGDLQGH